MNPSVPPAPMSDSDFITGCPSCGATINVATAPWCHCVTRQPNLVCASCGECGCRAGKAAMLAFWHHAPASLLARRVAEQNSRRQTAASHSSDYGDVIVIDDDEEIRLIASFMLQQMGYSVTVTSDPAAVLSMIETHPPRVVITDALMPKMDGRELSRLIKLADRSVQVVIMTSLYTAPRYKHEAFKKFRADAYLAKPIDFDEFREVLTRLCPLTADAVVTAVHA